MHPPAMLPGLVPAGLLALLAALGRVGAAALVAALALAVGVALSRSAHRRLDGRALRAAVLAFAVASAVVLIVRA